MCKDLPRLITMALGWMNIQVGITKWMCIRSHISSDFFMNCKNLVV